MSFTYREDSLNLSPRLTKERITFPNSEGKRLAALLEGPAENAAGFAIFAHCFTCSKDIAAASRISRGLAQLGFAVLRFDFTGLGNSEGDFANTNFSSNVADLVCAADYLREHHGPPALLIGHSLGGAAVLAAAGSIAEARAVVTIGAPSDPDHVTHLFEEQRSEIERRGVATVNLGGREFEVSRQFLEDVAENNLRTAIRGMRKALLIFHSPVDEIVSIDHAGSIFEAARHPKSFVSLDRADHLLSRPEDSRYVATTISAWASRYLLPPSREVGPRPRVEPGEVLVREIDRKFGQEIFTDSHRLLADEPADFGGGDTGPSPYEYLLAGLGACTSMTLRMYAARKQLPLDRVQVALRHEKIHARDCEACETTEGKVDRIEREIRLEGHLTEAQIASVLAIADKCPVHRTLHSEIEIKTQLKNAPDPTPRAKSEE